MRVVLAPDCFGGTLTAVQAADALARGWSRSRPVDALVRVPLSDGGPGFLDCLPGTTVSVLVQDPLGRPTAAAYLLDGTTAYVESAQAVGLHLLDPTDRDPTRTTSYGLGQLVRAAVEAGATRVVIGLGGTATNDGGRGFVEAVGPLDGVALVAATDVDNPLLGAAGATTVYAPQKGASPADLPSLEDRMGHWADVLEARLGVAARNLPGAGAAGGLGFALLALGATRARGFDVVAAATDLAGAVHGADLVVSGEGRLDATSLRGKVVSGVARTAAAEGVPVVVIAGEVLAGDRELGAAGIAEAHALVELVGRARAFDDAAEALADVAERVASSW